MDVTKHAIRRYVERIEGIKDETEINRYITLNSDLVKERILKIYEYSKWIYKGQIGTDKTTANFYLRDDIILVGDVPESKLYTLYRIDFDFPPETTKVIIKDLSAALVSLREELEKAQQGVDEYVEEKQYEIESCETQIKNLKEQIEIIEGLKKVAKEEIDVKRDTLQFYHKKIENYANKLCNSLEFKKDINANMIKSG